MKVYTKENYHSGGFQDKYKIYVLKNPKTGEIFYVGQTRKPLTDRLWGHIAAAKGKSEKFRNEIKDAYILEMLQGGGRPVIESVETIIPISYIGQLEIPEKEIAWMNKLKMEGHDLLNIMGLRVKQPNAKYILYLEALEKKSVPAKYYYSGKDIIGEPLYHRERILADGLSFGDEPAPPIKRIILPPVPKGLNYVQQLVWKERMKKELAIN
jgi:hypothetical protein